MFPSVSRLLSENNVSSQDSEKIKGTGVRGMLTKGDVLTYLGVVERPTGSFKEVKHGISALGGGAPTGSGKGGKPGEVKSEVSFGDKKNMRFRCEETVHTKLPFSNCSTSFSFHTLLFLSFVRLAHERLLIISLSLLQL